MNKVVSLLILASVTLSTVIPIHAQQQAPDVVRISTNLVQIDALVTDKSGNPVKDLSADDFEVLQDGKPQRIVSVSYVNTENPGSVSGKAEPARTEKTVPLAPPTRTNVANAARILTFVIDDGNCLASLVGITASKTALEKFVTEQMLPNDLVAIYQTRGGSSVLQQYTSDKAQLLRVARKVRWYPPQGMCSNEATGDFYDPARPTTFSKDRDSQTQIESESDRRNRIQIENRARENQVAGLIGVLRYITRGLQRVAGRKTVFLMSDGLPLMSQDSEPRGPASSPTVMMTLSNTQGVMRDLIDTANRASVVFNTIDVRGIQVPGAVSAQDTFSNLSGPTGNIHATSLTRTAREAIATNAH
ncbi:MAG TPA: VWA domain-containing protein, partial [Pyrinomonadaceae bacterium]|nr:VWA domain-containing protein [Pyrinomonadaceae bacterium]